MTPGRLVLLGHPVVHSVSPQMQNAALRSAGVDLTYEALDVTPEDLGNVLKDLCRHSAAGNVTRPHKKAVFAACDAVTDVAERSGAVNTFWTEDGKLTGDNTDPAGFDRAVRTLVGGDVAGKIIVLGSGGGAAGVLEAFSHWKSVSIDLVARNRIAAEELVGRYSGFARHVMMSPELLRGAKLIVNATPIGQDDDSVPFDVGQLATSCRVFDLVYRRGGTMLVRGARAVGLDAEDGTMMLVEQGALSFERWFAISPDRSAMYRAIA